ncbi:hypothetical protein NDU88_000903 [Pleurodeles waltl]|uniref:Uncharacterized protein n=1 Tax=Pleurodeles waltl TaxID=8319 RepID=A0AAV7VW09_PLEWA|nr:hypothetical protein NDU88_000903 [Pleurodeles waltl]
MGAYHHSQETMATVLDKFQETQRLQEEQYLGFREELRTISSALGTIVEVLKDIQHTMRDTVALQGAPDTSLDDELPTTSVGASGQDAPPQDHHTSTPPPADGQPPRMRSLRSRNRTEQDGKTPPGNETTLIVLPLSHFVTLILSMSCNVGTMAYKMIIDRIIIHLKNKKMYEQILVVGDASLNDTIATTMAI